MGSPAEFLVVLMTALILPGIAVLVGAFLTGGLEGMESVKYVVLAQPDEDEDDPADGPVPSERRRWGA